MHTSCATILRSVILEVRAEGEPRRTTSQGRASFEAPLRGHLEDDGLEASPLRAIL